MPVFALVDCNNFFVLSNNDGVVISRSEEAKALGIGMAAPFFEIRALVAERGVVAISANQELYADFSRRVTEVLVRHAPVVENYSIDESFLTFPDDDALDARARALRAEIGRWTGIPVSVGLAPTKALARRRRRAACCRCSTRASASGCSRRPRSSTSGGSRRPPRPVSPSTARAAPESSPCWTTP